MISSTGNKKVKELTAITKKSGTGKKRNVYIVEGIRMFRELKSDEILEVYVSESFENENRQTLRHIYPQYEILSDLVFEHISDTKTPQGVLAVVRRKEYNLNDILDKKIIAVKRPHMLLILDTLQDPGNLGTLLRAGEGANITGVIISKSTVDIYNPKVIRSTMGSIFRVPFTYVENLKETIQELKDRRINIYASSLESSTNYEEMDYNKDTAFIIGNEAAGIQKEVLDLVEKRIKIPMYGSVESLNAAVAGSILMYEAARQRRVKTEI